MEDKKVIEIIEKEYPEMMKDFQDFQKRQYNLFCRKQHDYGENNISLGLDLTKSKNIKKSLQGLWFRMNDKMQRFDNLIERAEAAVKDDPLEDIFYDLANYSIIAFLVSTSKWGR
jgi:hypothetical protein